MFRLDGKVAIVTGGARGIGAETARVFRDAGATVVTWDVADGADALVDVTDVVAAAKAAAAVAKEHGRIDVLVNNAGILRDAQLLKSKGDEITGMMSEADFDAVISVNLRGVFACTQAVAPTMIRQHSGRILNASSVVGLYGNFGQTNYVATKAAVIGMTKVWARELGPKGITVNAVAPGFIDTDMTRALGEEQRSALLAQIPMGRLGSAADIAATVLFLSSDPAGYITGETLHVNGGMYMP